MSEKNGKRRLPPLLSADVARSLSGRSKELLNRVCHLDRKFGVKTQERQRAGVLLLLQLLEMKAWGGR